MNYTNSATIVQYVRLDCRGRYALKRGALVAAAALSGNGSICSAACGLISSGFQLAFHNVELFLLAEKCYFW